MSSSGSSSTVLGEGTYGCVHKPSLVCADSTKNDLANRVFQTPISKLMYYEDAHNEMNEYNLIDGVDPDKNHYLGKPIRCNVNLKSQFNKNSAAKCNGLLSDNPDLVKDLQWYSLLLMENGGNDLVAFAKNLIKSPSSIRKKQEEMEYFWIEFHSVFIGLRQFKKGKIIHHDVKAQNLVYDQTTLKFNFIDFGLMTTYDKITKEAQTNTYNYTDAHWSFPVEIPFLTFNNFEKIRMSKDSVQTVVQDIFNNNKYNIYDCVNEVLYVRDFFNPLSNTDRLTEDFSKTIEHIKTNKYSYDMFVQKSIETIDTYGAGMGIFAVLDTTKQVLGTQITSGLTNIANSLCNLDLQARLDIDAIIPIYEKFLLDSGLLSKYNLHFENNVLKKGKSDIMELSNTIASNMRVLTKAELKNATASPPSRKSTARKSTARKSPARSQPSRKSQSISSYHTPLEQPIKKTSQQSRSNTTAKYTPRSSNSNNSLTPKQTKKTKRVKRTT